MNNPALRYYQVFILAAVIWSLSHGHLIAMAIAGLIGGFGYYFFYRHSDKQQVEAGDSDILKSNILNIAKLLILVLAVFAGVFYLFSLAGRGYADSTLARVASVYFLIIGAHSIRTGKAKIGRGIGYLMYRESNPTGFWIAIAIYTSIAAFFFLASEPTITALPK